MIFFYSALSGVQGQMVSKVVSARTTLLARQIEDGLAEVSTQVQQTGAPLAELPDASVFTIDRLGGASRDHEGRRSSGKREIRLTVDQILRPKSHFTVPSQRIGKAQRKVAHSALKPSKRAVQKTQPKVANGVFDLWADAVKSTTTTPPELASIRAVQCPHPGTSYNPDTASHQELVQLVVQEESRKIEQQARYKAQVAPIFTANPAAGESSMPVTLDDGSDHADDPEDACDQPKQKISSKTKRKRTTKEERRRQAQQERAQTQARLEAKRAREQAAELCHLKSINRQVRLELAKEQAAAAKHGSTNKSKKGPKSLKLGPCKFHPAPQAVKLLEQEPSAGEAGSSDLRRLVPEGNLVEERFKSLQERALIEPRMRVRPQKRKFALKAYEKHTYKRFK